MFRTAHGLHFYSVGAVGFSNGGHRVNDIIGQSFRSERNGLGEIARETFPEPPERFHIGNGFRFAQTISECYQREVLSFVVRYKSQQSYSAGFVLWLELE